MEKFSARKKELARGPNTSKITASENQATWNDVLFWSNQFGARYWYWPEWGFFLQEYTSMLIYLIRHHMHCGIFERMISFIFHRASTASASLASGSSVRAKLLKSRQTRKEGWKRQAQFVTNGRTVARVRKIDHRKAQPSASIDVSKLNADYCWRWLIQAKCSRILTTTCAERTSPSRVARIMWLDVHEWFTKDPADI